MSAPYLEELYEACKKHGPFRDLYEAAEKTGIDFQDICLTLNNGLLKGFWRIELTFGEPAIGHGFNSVNEG